MKLKGEKMADELVSQQYEDLAASDSATQMRITVGFKLLNVSPVSYTHLTLPTIA